jgi:hypothetical protein
VVKSNDLKDNNMKQIDIERTFYYCFLANGVYVATVDVI